MMRFSRRLMCTCMAGGLLAVVAPAACGAQGLYQRRDTWAETMTATREALRVYRVDHPFYAAVTPVIRGGEPAQRIELDLTGAATLRLVATIGPDTYNYDQAIWAEPVLVAPDSAQTPLSALTPVTAKVGWGTLCRDSNHGGDPLRIGDQTFAHGFWAHAPSELQFNLDRAYVRFEAWVGIDAGAGANGSAAFQAMTGEDPLAAIWPEIERDFPKEAHWFASDFGEDGKARWFGDVPDAADAWAVIGKVIEQTGSSGAELRVEYETIRNAASAAEGRDALALYARAAALRQTNQDTVTRLARVDLAALRRAVRDLMAAYPAAYPNGSVHLARLDAIALRLDAVREAAVRGDGNALREAAEILALQRAALLENPLLSFESVLVVRRSDRSPALGLPHNWQGNCSLPRGEYDNEIAVISLRDPADRGRVVFRPPDMRFVGDVDLHFDADRMLFSMPDDRGRHQIWEVRVDGSKLRQVTAGEEPDVDNYDACYLPDERIIYGSTACYHGIPCVFGGDSVANLHIMNPDGSGSRQLCVDQDHDWCPTLLHNGRVLYLRWEYGDLPHSNSRILFHMNPDGTSQMEYYGSNSYWPNGIFFARPIPDHPTQVIGIVTGHHGVRRMGELVIFDPAKGRGEADGVVQRIPGYGRPVEPIIRDRLVDDSWPKFLQPYPLSGKYFLVAAQPTASDNWGLYLVDVFDNMLLLREEPGHVLFEPIPLRPTPRPPVIPDRVNPSKRDAVVYLADVYRGPGLDGVPAGTVKSLRVFAYVFSYRGMGGLLGMVGMDGPWDVKRILGTVPVEEDGSALFRVPAYTPIAVQPLDAEGKALQIMRSWFTAMPGETLSCVGCHERQSMSPPPRATLASRRAPSEIAPWYGPARGFSFAREVQPVLDRYCVSCHDETTPPDLRGREMITDWTSNIAGHANPELGGKFSKSYAELHRYVRRPGIESDMHLLCPMEYHADTTELVQILQKGHYGVTLDREGWDRIVTWIDLNAPYHGSWREMLGEQRVVAAAERRNELRRKYCGMEEPPEAALLPPMMADNAPAPQAFSAPRETTLPTSQDWSFTPEEARRRQEALGAPERTVPLPDGSALRLALVPAGSFVMGDATGAPDARPAALVNVDASFWISVFEITNAQYALFDPAHDSHVESKHGYQFGVHGYPLDEPEQPVVRVSWEQAMAFCGWLSARTGESFALPTETQWEYACRAGAATPFHFGGIETDFSLYGNLGGIELERLASNPYLLDEEPLPNPNRYDDWVPHDTRYSDGSLVSAAGGARRPNAWGLYDMHGNVWEWTSSLYHPYPYSDEAGHGTPIRPDKRVVRGGSWYDRPERATAAYRLAYASWQRVFNVGFRVVCPAGEATMKTAMTAGENK